MRGNWAVSLKTVETSVGLVLPYVLLQAAERIEWLSSPPDGCCLKKRSVSRQGAVR